MSLMRTEDRWKRIHVKAPQSSGMTQIIQKIPESELIRCTRRGGRREDGHVVALRQSQLSGVSKCSADLRLMLSKQVMERRTSPECIVISSSESDNEVEVVHTSNQNPTTSLASTNKILKVSLHPLSMPYMSKAHRSTRCAIVAPLPRTPDKNKERRPSNDSNDDIDRIVATLEEKLQSKRRKRRHKRSKKRKLDEMRSASLGNLSTPSSQNKDLEPSLGGFTRSKEKCKIGLRSEVKRVVPFQLSQPPTKKTKSAQRSSDGDSDVTQEIQYLLAKKTSSGGNKTNKFQTNGVVSDVDTTDSDVEYRKKKKAANSSNSEQESKTNTYLPEEDLEQKQISLEKVRNGSLTLEEVCLTCGTVENVDDKHPLFIGGLCNEHLAMFREWYFKYDEDGCQRYCAVCCMGRNVVVCDNPDCGRCYCSDCLHLLVGPQQYKEVAALEKWSCYFCGSKPNKGLLQTRENWTEQLSYLLSEKDETAIYPIQPVPAPVALEDRKPIRVLSLFDGIATGIVALKDLGLQIGKFVASEINEDAIRLVQNRHPEVVHIGDVTKFTDDDVRRMGPFDLVMGGSPCNDLSGANPRRKGLIDPEGSGCLFFDFHRILRAAQPNPQPAGCRCGAAKESARPFFWLFENVMSMKLIERGRISRFLQCEPITANAKAVSAAARPRLFWGNIPGMRQFRLDPSPADRLTVQECLEPGRVAIVDKLNTITTNPSCLYVGSAVKQPAVKHAGKDDTLWSTEVERIFGVPEHYTDVNNLGPKERLALLGRSWSVPVVRQILAPLKEYFKRK